MSNTITAIEKKEIARVLAGRETDKKSERQYTTYGGREQTTREWLIGFFDGIRITVINTNFNGVLIAPKGWGATVMHTDAKGWNTGGYVHATDITTLKRCISRMVREIRETLAKKSANA